MIWPEGLKHKKKVFTTIKPKNVFLDILNNALLNSLKGKKSKIENSFS